MSLPKLFLAYWFGLSYSYAFAMQNAPEYDNVPIAPQTWQEVNLTYDNYIDGKKYTEIVKLLRPISWLKQRNLKVHNLNQTVHLTKDDIGADVNARITAINSTNIYYDNKSIAKNLERPVIGVFIRHANNVTDYTFKDQSGNLETIQATPEHPFYSIDRHDYIPIGQIWQDFGKYNGNEHIQTDTGKSVTLVEAKLHNGQIETVYNFEVYKAHNYLVGDGGLLVHNPDGLNCIYDSAEYIVSSKIPKGLKGIERNPEIFSDTGVMSEDYKRPLYIDAHGKPEYNGQVTIRDNGVLQDNKLNPPMPIMQYIDEVVKPKIQSLPEQPDCIILAVCHAATNGIGEAFAQKFPDLPIFATDGIVFGQGSMLSVKPSWRNFFSGQQSWTKKFWAETKWYKTVWKGENGAWYRRLRGRDPFTNRQLTDNSQIGG